MLRVSGADAEYFARDGARCIRRLLDAARRPGAAMSSLLGRQEKLVLDFVRGKVPVVLPDWQVHTDKLIAYRVLPGVPAAEIDPLMGELIWRLPQDRVAPSTFAESLAGGDGEVARARCWRGGERGHSSGGRGRAARAHEAAHGRVQHACAKVPDLLWGLWQKWIDGDAISGRIMSRC
jgi:macrolide phosphotransferase